MQPVDLSNCDSEPIHVPSAIQPHGVLLGCRLPSLEVAYASENLAGFFGVAAPTVLGQHVAALFRADSARLLSQVAGDERPRDQNPVRLLAQNGAPFDAVFHRAPGEFLVIELEPPSGEVSFHSRLRRSLSRLSDTSTSSDLWHVAAEEVRALTGFDRVMIYRFDPAWNGEVVAEAKRADLETFLGLHYPASDIPAQARRLYTINWLRFIGDVNYQPVPLRALDEAAPPLDMSFCVLRSVSPIHCEYLRNMGVTASMSISLLHERTRLWGLIACHHYSGPRVVPYMVRESSEFLGQALSWHIASHGRAESAQRGLATKEIESRLIHAMNEAVSYRDGLAIPALLQLTDARGAAVLVENDLRTVGVTPSEDEIRALVSWLRANAEDELFAEQRMSARWPMSAAFEDTASGVLALALSRELGDYVLWFRPSEEQVVHWAGEPKKELTTRDGIERLSPRGSFALWKETVRGCSTPWQPWELDAARDLRGAVLHAVRRRAAELAEINDKLVAADRAKDVFLAAVSHELRTPLHAILGWLHRLRHAALDGPRTQKALEIIERNATIQAQLVDDLLDVARMVEGKMSLTPSVLALAQVAQRAIETVALVAEAGGVALEVAALADGYVHGDAARLQQVVWNLLSNALKFTPRGGAIQISLHATEDSLELAIRDSGRGLSADALPKLFEPFWQERGNTGAARKGLGLGLAIVRHIVQLHGGTITAESAGIGSGSTFRVVLPRVQAPDEGEPTPPVP